MKYKMMFKILDYLFPITGGAAGALTANIITIERGLSLMADAFILAFIGGITGFLVKKLMDFIWDKLKFETKKKRKKK